MCAWDLAVPFLVLEAASPVILMLLKQLLAKVIKATWLWHLVLSLNPSPSFCFKLSYNSLLSQILLESLHPQKLHCNHRQKSIQCKRFPCLLVKQQLDPISSFRNGSLPFRFSYAGMVGRVAADLSLHTANGSAFAVAFSLLHRSTSRVTSTSPWVPWC